MMMIIAPNHSNSLYRLLRALFARKKSIKLSFHPIEGQFNARDTVPGSPRYSISGIFYFYHNKFLMKYGRC